MRPHRVNVMRPTEAKGDLGQREGQDAVICKDWPCSIKTLSGKEAETARTTAPDAQYEVEGYGDPKWTNRETYYLTGGTLGERKLHVAFVDDADLNGIKLRLICGENK